MDREARQLVYQPQQYYDGLVADIDAAERELILEVYIFELDDVGNKVLEALQNAGSRGVSIRLLLDGVGSYRDANAIASTLESETCEVRIFHPLPWDFALYRHALEADNWYSQILHFLGSMNHRDHRKLCVIDGHIAWLGSYNITSDHYNITPQSDSDYWHDTGLRVTGVIVKSLKDNFEQVWERKISSRSKRSRGFLARGSISRRSHRNLQLLQVLEGATHRILITNAYFNPSNRLLKVLKRQSAAGVLVQVIVPARSDVMFFPLLSRSYYTDLLSANIRVFEYHHRVLHSKTMIIDSSLLVGSTNLNYRSLFHDLELDALITDADIVQQMQNRFEEDIGLSREIFLMQWQQHSGLVKLLGWFSRFLRYWL